MRGPFRKISGHGIIPLIIGAAIAEGTSHMFARSLAVLLCAIWFSLDVGIWISETNWKKHYKQIAFCVTACLLYSCALGIMLLFLRSVLADQQEEVYAQLDIEVPKIETDNPVTTMFSVKNIGSTDIRYHHIACLDNLIVFDPLNVVQGPGRSSYSKQLGPLGHSGEIESVPCLAMFHLGIAVCADVTISMDYSLDTQPGILKNKQARFITRKEGNHFVWYGEPVRGSDDPCRDVLQKLVTYPLDSLPWFRRRVPPP